jgi:hypothetical protein
MESGSSFSVNTGWVAVTIHCESMERAEEATLHYLEIIQLSARYLHPASIVLCAPQRDQYAFQQVRLSYQLYGRQ